jgi:hypothetical protein
VFELRNPLRTNGVNGPPELLDAAGKPDKLLFGDPIMFRLCRAAHYAEWRDTTLVSNNFAVIGSA